MFRISNVLIYFLSDNILFMNRYVNSVENIGFNEKMSFVCVGVVYFWVIVWMM